MNRKEEKQKSERKKYKNTKPPKIFQKVLLCPKTSQNLQKQLKMSKNITEKTSQNPAIHPPSIPKHPKISLKTSKKCPEISQNIPNGLKMSQNTSQNVPKHSKMSQNVPKHPKTTQHVPKCPKTSLNTNRTSHNKMLENIPKRP